MATKSKTTRGNNHSTEDERLQKIRKVNETSLISNEEPTVIESKGNANIFHVNSQCDFSLPRRLPPPAPIVSAESHPLLDVEAPFSQRLLDLDFIWVLVTIPWVFSS
jgi:hypothetical protein